jgi:uncharacterized protein YfbU (UPF0304 family)
MAPKSERFEMRVDEDILARVDAWRSDQQGVPSRAEAMRRLVELGLEVDKPTGTIHLSDGEKLILLALKDLFKQANLHPGETDLDFISEVIIGGHYWAPRWKMSGVFHDHRDDLKSVRFVVDVLDMFSFVESATKQLSKRDKARVEGEAEPMGRHVKFRGFDGNNEADLLSIAHFFIHKMNRFTEFREHELNSHMPTVAAYKRMLKVFLPIRHDLSGTGLSVDQLIAILRAWRYQGE